MQKSSDDRRAAPDDPPQARQRSLALLAILLSFLGLLLLVFCMSLLGLFPALAVVFIAGLIVIGASFVALWQAVRESKAYWAIPVVLLFSFASFFAAFTVVTEVNFKRYYDRPTCISNLRKLWSAMEMYAENHDSQLPLADTWCDAISPYVNDEKSFVCPELPDVRCGYTLNSLIAGVNLDSIPKANYAVTLFDGRGGWNLAGGRSDVVFRHNDLAYVLFTDGHVKGYSREHISLLTWSPAAEKPVSAVPIGR